MTKNYSAEFINVLSERVNTKSKQKVDRPLCKSLAIQRASGKELSYLDLDHDTLRTLCVNELCPDGLIATIFNTDKDLVKALRDLYGYTDEGIPAAYTAYITTKLAKELEFELGESAFA